MGVLRIQTDPFDQDPQGYPDQSIEDSPLAIKGFFRPCFHMRWKLSNQEGLGGRQQGRANLSSIWTPTWYRLQGPHAACTILESRSIVKSPALPNFLALLPRGTGNYKGPAT